MQKFVQLNKATSYALQGATSGIGNKLSMFEDNKILLDRPDDLIVDP
jgi:hypothetical protein